MGHMARDIPFSSGMPDVLEKGHRWDGGGKIRHAPD